MKDATGKVIYVGKSKRLSARVASYFTGNEHSVKTARMVAQVADFDTILCDSEIEALQEIMLDAMDAGEDDDENEEGGPE